MRLPPEIRNRIYDLALGNKVIHIGTEECDKTDCGAYSGDRIQRTFVSSPRYVKLVHVVCNEPVDAEEVAYRNSTDLSQGVVPPYASRHKDCYALFSEDRSKTTSSAEQQKQARHGLTMNLIQVSRDIHREAALIPYVNNTFAFDEGTELDFFVTKILLAPQRAAIKTLQIDGYMDAGLRYASITSKVPKMLTGLRTLEESSPACIYMTNTERLYRMFGRGLETVRVICEDSDRYKLGSRPKERLRKWAERIEEELVKKVYGLQA